MILSPEERFIDKIIKKLSETELELEIEESVGGILGVHINRSESGQIKLT